MFLNVKIIEELNLLQDLKIGQKFKRSFQDTLNPIWSCRVDIELTSHYILHCPMYNDERHTLLSTIKNID